jgi:hypothetical protein
MADGIDEIGTIQRVEVERGNSLIDKIQDLLGSEGGSR